MSPATSVQKTSVSGDRQHVCSEGSTLFDGGWGGRRSFTGFSVFIKTLILSEYLDIYHMERYRHRVDRRATALLLRRCLVNRVRFRWKCSKRCKTAAYAVARSGRGPQTASRCRGDARPYAVPRRRTDLTLMAMESSGPVMGMSNHAGRRVVGGISRWRGLPLGGGRRVPPGGRQGAGRSRSKCERWPRGVRPATTFGQGVESGQVARLRSGPPRPGDAGDQRVRPRLSGPARPRRTTPNWTLNSTRSSTRVRSMTCGPARLRALPGRQAPGRAGVAGARGAWPA